MAKLGKLLKKAMVVSIEDQITYCSKTIQVGPHVLVVTTAIVDNTGGRDGRSHDCHQPVGFKSRSRTTDAVDPPFFCNAVVLYAGDTQTHVKQMCFTPLSQPLRSLQMMLRWQKSHLGCVTPLSGCSAVLLMLTNHGVFLFFLWWPCGHISFHATHNSSNARRVNPSSCTQSCYRGWGWPAFELCGATIASHTLCHDLRYITTRKRMRLSTTLRRRTTASVTHPVKRAHTRTPTCKYKKLLHLHGAADEIYCMKNIDHSRKNFSRSREETRVQVASRAFLAAGFPQPQCTRTVLDGTL